MSPKKRFLIVAVLAVLCLASALVTLAAREPRLDVVISNHTDRPVRAAELSCPEGRWAFPSIAPGESRRFSIAQASALDLHFQCVAEGTFKKSGLSVGMPPGEYLTDVEFSLTPGMMGNNYHSEITFPTRVRLLLRDLRGRIGL